MARPSPLSRPGPQMRLGLGTFTITIGDLFDVDLTGLADGYVIIWDDATDTWVVGPQTGSGGESEFPRPLMAQDPDDDHWYVVVDGDGTAVMVTG